METRHWKFFPACVLFALAIAGCGGDGGGYGNGGGEPPAGAKKLLARILTEGAEERVFQYDNRNRLIADGKLGIGNKIEYQGDDSRPVLVTNGTPYSTACTGYDPDAGTFFAVPAVYTQYRYGEDDLLNGVSTKYYQTRFLDQDKTRNSCNDPLGTLYPRYYLNSDDRKIAWGGAYDPDEVPTNFFVLSSGLSVIYDGNSNLVEKIIDPAGAFVAPTSITCKYTYDDRKNPASGMTTPLWWFWDGDNDWWDVSSNLFLSNTNNPLSSVCSGQEEGIPKAVETHYSYTYDQEGYPTAVDVTVTSRDYRGVEVTTNIKRTFEYIAAH
ncbi:MAG: hypothetical protein FWF41_04075 [Betaproteobacteria bacterium]|nr:hypothetical protein [Betaproteobacteria bacterium]